MGVNHVFDRIGDQLPRGQRVQHPAVAHRNTVIHRNRVEFFGDAASPFNLSRHQLAQILQVNMAGYKLGEGIGDSDDWLAKIALLDASGPP